MSDNFTKRKLEWLERVQDDQSLGPSHVALAFAIGRHLNRSSGDAWPRQATLGELMRLQPRQVRTLLRQIEAAGHLTVVSGGYQRPDRYAPATPADRQGIATLRPAANCRTERPERQSIAVQTGSALPPNPLKEPFELREEVSPAPLIAEPDDFEVWWEAYSHKVGKRNARPAYWRARKKPGASREALLDRASAYAATRRCQDPNFTKHPTSWLNGEHWLDEPAAPATQTASNRSTPRSALDWVQEEF
jgi:hypothetical protein